MSRKIHILFYFASILLAGALLAAPCHAENLRCPEIHCKHFFCGYPIGTPPTNDLIIRDVYALSSNDETKLADWVAYLLDKETVSGDVKTRRKWQADPWLSEEETLEPDDYKKAHETLKVDRGHQAPLASFKGTKNWAETNFLSNITPQKSDLNQGPWLKLEEKVRNLVKADNIVYVMTGPFFVKCMPCLPNADEPHKVPSGYWKIIIVQADKTIDSIKCASFILDQNTPRRDNLLDHLCTINDIEAKTGLDFLRELPDDMEQEIENSRYETWALKNFE